MTKLKYTGYAYALMGDQGFWHVYAQIFDPVSRTEWRQIMEILGPDTDGMRYLIDKICVTIDEAVDKGKSSEH